MQCNVKRSCKHRLVLSNCAMSIQPTTFNVSSGARSAAAQAWSRLSDLVSHAGSPAWAGTSWSAGHTFAIIAAVGGIIFILRSVILTQYKVLLQVVDNLVLLHSQAEGRSRIYDLQLVSKDPAVEVNIRISFFLLHFDFLRWISTYFFQVDGPDLLQPSLPATAICRQVCRSLSCDKNNSLNRHKLICFQKDCGHSQPLPYSPSWVVFRPNVLVDARTGDIFHLSQLLQ